MAWTHRSEARGCQALWLSIFVASVVRPSPKPYDPTQSNRNTQQDNTCQAANREDDLVKENKHEPDTSLDAQLVKKFLAR